MQKLTRIFLLVLLLSALRSPLSAVYAEVPHLINYQGRLTDTSNTPLNGAYAVTFRIYDAQTAGNLLWEETHIGLLIQKGVFGVLLGSVTNLTLAFDKPYFLEIKVGAEVMSPRQRITSSGYAINAENGVPKGAIIMWSGKIADIPSGWVMCDGINGTPDLRDRFVVGAREDIGGYALTNITGSLTQSGGSAYISVANLPSHAHSLNAITATTSSNGAHTHTLPLAAQSFMNFTAMPTNAGQIVSSFPTSSAGEHTHTVTLSGNTQNTGSGMTYTQPYYALCFIMKT